MMTALLVLSGIAMISLSIYATKKTQIPKWDSDEKVKEIYHVNNETTADWNTAIPNPKKDAEQGSDTENKSDLPIL